MTPEEVRELLRFAVAAAGREYLSQVAHGKGNLDTVVAAFEAVIDRAGYVLHLEQKPQ